MTGTKSNGEKSDLWFRATACFRRDDGHWRITHIHKRRRADKESNIGIPLRTAGSTTGPIPRDAGRARSTATTPVAASVSRTRAAISWRSSLRL